MSRLGLARVVFPPYTREQIKTILKARLEKLDVFKSDAVELAAGKVCVRVCVCAWCAYVCV